MKVLVTGDRNYTNLTLIQAVLSGLQAGEKGNLTVIHGGARGADSLAETACRRLGIPTLVFPANWQAHGKGAGPIRNREMLAQQPDLVLAFHDDLENSKGTKDMVHIARKANVPVFHIRRLEGVRDKRVVGDKAHEEDIHRYGLF